jgi:hypothetical protein
MNRLRRTRTIVVANVLAHDATDVIDAEEDKVVQGVLPEGTIEPLDVRGSVGCAVRDGESLDAHYLIKPSVKVAAITVCLAIPFYRNTPAILTADTVIVVDEKTGSVVRPSRLTDLLLHPRKRG